MRGWRTVIAGAALLGLLVVDPAGAQAAPTLTATPGAADPGDTITVTVEGCDEAPRVGYQVVDGSGQTFEVDTVDAGGGAYSTQLEAPFGDLYVYLLFGECGVGTTIGESPTARVDVEAPLLYALGSTQVPEDIYGTDCPAGATPEVTVTFGDQSHDIDDLDVDDLGDWTFFTLDELPFAPSGPGTVEATCGDVVYDTLVLDVAGGTTTTATTEPSQPSAPAATPVLGAARFTG